MGISQKEEEKRAELNSVMIHLAESLRIVAILLATDHDRNTSQHFPSIRIGFCCHES